MSAELPQLIATVTRRVPDGLPVGALEYGRSYAESFPNGHFVPVPEAGHFPHLAAQEEAAGVISFR